MKQMIKHSIAIVALLLVSMGAVADGLISKKNITIDGTPSSEDVAGTINYSNGEISITPKSGYYFSLDNPNDLIVIKTIDGENAQTRTPNINTPLEVTAKDATADPSKETKYTFTVTDEKYNYEITANFHTRTSIEGAEVTVSGGPFVYTGEPIKPTLAVTLGGKDLTLSTDYNAYDNDSIKAGVDKIITLVGIRKYSGTRTDIKYTIEKAEITPVVSITGWAYGEKANEPKITEGNPGNGEVTFAYKVKDASDETYVAEAPVTVGNYTIKATIAETDNYKRGEAMADFVISAKSISAATITLTPENLTFNGQNQKPEVSVKDGEKDLVLDTDYTLTNEGGTNVGEYTVTISGKGNYDPATTTSKKYNITTRETTPTIVLTEPETPIVYDGTEKKPAVKVTMTLTEGTDPIELTTDDYDIVYSDNINAGENTAKATVTLKHNCKGTATTTFTITPKSIADVTIEDIADQAYTGKAIEPTIKVKDGDKELTLNTDYTVSYSNNTMAAKSDTENPPTVTITGMGNYDPNTVATKTFTIGKAQAELKYSTDKATAAMGTEFEAPTLTTTPEGLEGITYTSSNTDAATINAEGKVTLVNTGETKITASFPGNDNYNAAEASYTLTVEKGVGDGYALWIGETQVTEDNCMDILGDRKQAFTFNPQTNTLLITNNQDKDIVIESRLDELTIYLNGNKNDKGNKLKKVFFNNLGNAENKGKLMFTTNYNVPGSIDLKNDPGESVITGFESIEFDSKSQLTFVLPEKTTYAYENGLMNKTVEDENGTTTNPADELSIGQSLTPIDEVVTFSLSNLYLRDEDGNVIRDDSGEPTLPNLVNSVVKDVLITLPGSNDDNSGDGISIDDSDGRVGITIETTSMTDDKVKTIAQKVISNDDYFPGSDDFAKEFVGMTILLPACIGTIKTDLDIDPGYEFHALIAEDNAGVLKSTIKVIEAGEVKTPFEVAQPTYCYIYLVKTGSASTRLGKRTKAHGKVYTVGIEVNKAMSANPPSVASGGALPASADPVLNTTDPDPDPDPYYPPYPYTPPTAIKNVDQETINNDKWFTIEGQQIDTPTIKGIYIKNGKKVVIK